MQDLRVDLKIINGLHWRPSLMTFLSFKFSDNTSIEGASMPIQEEQRNSPKDCRYRSIDRLHKQPSI